MSSSRKAEVPKTILDLFPNLRDERCVFYEFGEVLLDEGNIPAVMLLTESALHVASFPRHASYPDPRSIVYRAISGISRKQAVIEVKVEGHRSLHFSVPKVDALNALLVRLLDIQDRVMSRSLHLAASSEQKEESVPKVNASSHSETVAQCRAVRHAGEGIDAREATAEKVLDLQHSEELNLGILRLGRGSLRSQRPPKELDEESEASSCQTTEQNFEQAVDPDVDVAPVSVDRVGFSRRLWYFFYHYDRSKLPFVDAIVVHHRGRETELLEELEQRYGPEPGRKQWHIRDRIVQQREINKQLKAQLARARDELVYLSQLRVSSTKNTWNTKVAAKKRSLVQDPSSEQTLHCTDTNTMELIEVSTASTPTFWFAAPIGFSSRLEDQLESLQAADLSKERERCIISVSGRPDHFSCNVEVLVAWARGLPDHVVSVAEAPRGSRCSLHDSKEWWKQFVPHS